MIQTKLQDLDGCLQRIKNFISTELNKITSNFRASLESLSLTIKEDIDANYANRISENQLNPFTDQVLKESVHKETSERIIG